MRKAGFAREDERRTPLWAYAMLATFAGCTAFNVFSAVRSLTADEPKCVQLAPPVDLAPQTPALDAESLRDIERELDELLRKYEGRPDAPLEI